MKIVVFFIVLGISYHALNGVRHILWDLGLLINNRAASMSGLIIIFSSVILSIFVSSFLGIF